jgi:hypothetical protein
MAKLAFPIHLSRAQICIFESSLEIPFNNWSKRNYSQGFSWRPKSVSFRALVEDGEHQINLFINEPIFPISADCIRAFKVPFEVLDGNIEIASIADAKALAIPPGKYSLQIEFLSLMSNKIPQVNIYFNSGECDFLIIKSDNEIDSTTDLDLMAQPAE